MPRSGQRSVTLTDGMLETIDKLLIDLREHGVKLYNNRSEFIKEAIREHIRRNRTTYLLGVREE